MRRIVTVRCLENYVYKETQETDDFNKYHIKMSEIYVACYVQCHTMDFSIYNITISQKHITK